MQQIIYTNSITEAITWLVDGMSPATVHIITDTNVADKVLPSLDLPYHVIMTPPGDTAKNLDTLSHIWTELINAGATRKSVVINIGGGVVTDMGGFAAATFKRGIRFINVPTTLLSAVDAAVGREASRCEGPCRRWLSPSPSRGVRFRYSRCLYPCRRG